MLNQLLDTSHIGASILNSNWLSAQSSVWLNVCIDVTIKATLILLVAGVLGYTIRQSAAIASFDLEFCTCQCPGFATSFVCFAKMASSDSASVYIENINRTTIKNRHGQSFGIYRANGKRRA